MEKQQETAGGGGGGNSLEKEEKKPCAPPFSPFSLYDSDLTGRAQEVLRGGGGGETCMTGLLLLLSAVAGIERSILLVCVYLRFRL